MEFFSTGKTVAMWEFFREGWKGWGKAGRWRSRDQDSHQTDSDVRCDSWNLTVVEDNRTIRYSGLLLKDGHTLWWRKIVEENGPSSAEEKKAWWKEARKERSFEKEREESAKEPKRGPEKRGGTAVTWWRRNPDMPFTACKEEVAPRCETVPEKRAEEELPCARKEDGEPPPAIRREEAAAGKEIRPKKKRKRKSRVEGLKRPGLPAYWKCFINPDWKGLRAARRTLAWKYAELLNQVQQDLTCQRELSRAFRQITLEQSTLTKVDRSTIRGWLLFDEDRVGETYPDEEEEDFIF